MSAKCKNCGRKLTDPESVERGYGPQCWEEVKGESAPMGDMQIPGQMDIFDFLGRKPAGAPGKICPSCGRVFIGHGAVSRKDNRTEICPACGAEEAIDALQGSLGSRATPEQAEAFRRMKAEIRAVVEESCKKGDGNGRMDGNNG